MTLLRRLVGLGGSSHPPRPTSLVDVLSMEGEVELGATDQPLTRPSPGCRSAGVTGPAVYPLVAGKGGLSVSPRGASVPAAENRGAAHGTHRLRSGER